MEGADLITQTKKQKNHAKRCIKMKRLTDFEKQVYDFIKERGEILISNMPKRMMGAIPNLKNKGLVKIYKKYTNKWASKKRKFVSANAQPNTLVSSSMQVNLETENLENK